MLVRDGDRQGAACLQRGFENIRAPTSATRLTTIGAAAHTSSWRAPTTMTFAVIEIRPGDTLEYWVDPAFRHTAGKHCAAMLARCR
jgi:hypothetical protein